ncbi:glycosyltransferase [Halomarina pelagica]|uniref:glycosyltransferase n=1 Tax=Halomarina pelagica TaxID=2961599 RepID=UPI0020C50758|nr:glycosyltransferase [Halomarina sp. BND7]
MTEQSTTAAGTTAVAARATVPFVSVIVPVYNDPEGLRATLDTLIDQTYPEDHYEILVVDNRSNDGTRAVAQEYAERFDHLTALDERRRQSSYAARTRALHCASGDVVAFIDADMTVDPDWLERVVETMEEDEIDYLACNVRLYSVGEESLAAKFNRLSGFPIEDYVSEFHYAPTCCLVVRREVVDDVGPFDVRFTSSGDREFGHRVYQAGWTLGYAPDIDMYHPTRTTLKALVKKSIRIGRGKNQLRRIYPERYGSSAQLIFNPAIYLPATPGQVRNALRGWDDLSLSEKLLFYALTYLLKLTNAYGAIRDAVESRR